MYSRKRIVKKLISKACFIFQENQVVMYQILAFFLKGMRFAEQDLHVALCSILLNFKLQYPITDPLEQTYSTLLFPAGPVRVQFISRN